MWPKGPGAAAGLPESLTAAPVCGPAAPQSRRRPVLGDLINEYEYQPESLLEPPVPAPVWR
jgi:hypothetical protein